MACWVVNDPTKGASVLALDGSQTEVSPWGA